jgi:hypothetical protein
MPFGSSLLLPKRWRERPKDLSFARLALKGHQGREGADPSGDLNGYNPHSLQAVFPARLAKALGNPGSSTQMRAGGRASSPYPAVRMTPHRPLVRETEASSASGTRPCPP